LSCRMGKLRGAMHRGNGASSLSQRKSSTGRADKKRQPNINRSSSARDHIFTLGTGTPAHENEHNKCYAGTLALMLEALGTETPAPRTNKPTATSTSHSVLKKLSLAVDGRASRGEPCLHEPSLGRHASSDDCLYSRTRDIHRGCVSASTNKVRSTCSHHTLGSQLPAYRHRKTQHGSVCKGRQQLCICTVRTTD
jgi:hypothetical protein